MSLDGKIATRTNESRLSSQRDLRRVHMIRSRVDGIMVGLRTMLCDDPKLRVKYFHDNHPARIVVDSKARTPLDSYIVKTASSTPTIVAVTTKAPQDRKSTRLNSSHSQISYAVFCLKKNMLKITATFVSAWTSLSRRRYARWSVASSDVVGSSATRPSGCRDTAIALSTRWRIPPLT